MGVRVVRIRGVGRQARETHYSVRGLLRRVPRMMLAVAYALQSEHMKTSRMLKRGLAVGLLA